ncbi:MAG: DUF4160 domain-containing protein [Cytophagales bacterium]|nr:DUF4160 domain-containing protein [Cytophagales bacterium]
MPEISRFYGIIIRMFAGDHGKPHFHAYYAEYEAKIDLDTLEIIKGNLPKRSLKLVQEWAILHRKELNENWKIGQNIETFNKIESLK